MTDTSRINPHRALYRSARWAKYRDGRLVGGAKLVAHTRDSWKCQRCGVLCTTGRKSPDSAVAHHRKPHRGDLVLFYDPDNVETVCKACHDSTIQGDERRGYSLGIGPDGWPTCPDHPANR